MAGRRGYSQFCPVAKAAEVFAERWTPLVLRELLAGTHRFSDLRKGIALISPSVLSQRLKELERAGLIERRPGDTPGGFDYRPTLAGEELQPVIEQLGIWGHRWIQAEIEPVDLDASLLMWDMHRRIEAELLPRRRVVVQFWYPDAPQGLKRWWLVLEPGDIDVCNKNPGFPVDLTVETTLHLMTEIWQGDRVLADALRAGDLRIEGPPDLTRRFPSWLKLSIFAQEQRRLQARRAVGNRG